MYPRFQLARSFKIADSSAAADQTITSSFVDLFPTQLTLSIPALAGDVLEMWLRAKINGNTGDIIYSDFVVNGTRLGGATGLGQTLAPTGFGSEGLVLVHWRTVITGDISSGSVTVKPSIATTGNAPTVESTTPPTVFIVKNLGPPNPH